MQEPSASGDTRIGNTFVSISPVLSQMFSIGNPDPVNFVDTVVHECIDASASDVLFEPTRENLRVRTRIDGVLYELGRIDLKTYVHIAARIKILTNLDPTEKRRVQEGQYTIEYKDRVVNLRVEIAKTIHGELIVIRVHEKKTIVMDLTNLGFTEEDRTTYWNMIQKRSGLVLVCGPTGCGKTTTLYSTISKLNEKQNYNVMTIEDPVEFQLDGVNQMQTQAETGFTFADGLRTILRVTPDIVLVGEIRDKETAQIAVESGLTGHLVLSTIHAEDSVGALFRLLDLGIESYLLNSALVGIVAQRLVRRTCQNCRNPYEPNADEIDLFKKTMGRVPKSLARGKGCEICRNLSYHGRVGIYEVLAMNPSVRDMVRKKINENESRKTMSQAGFTTLLKDGLIKCEQGITTVDEVLRNSFRSV